MVPCYSLVRFIILGYGPFFDDAYGSAGIWCWIHHKSYQFSVWYGPMIFLCLQLIYTYCILYENLNGKY